MDRVLPYQWTLSSLHVQARRQDDFADKLQSQKEQGRARSDHFATTRDSAASVYSSTVAAKGFRSSVVGKPEVGELDQLRVPGASISANLKADDVAFDGDLDLTVDPATVCEDASMQATGLLSGMLTWSRVYPEHLIASGYLSEIDTVRPDREVWRSGLDSPGPGVDVHESGMNIPASPTGTDLQPAETPQVSRFDSSAQSIANAIASKAPGSGPEVTSSRELSAAVLADHFWAERLVRLTPDSNGRNTLWLRDYRLDEGDIERAAMELRQRHEREGGLVDRIVINGREIWRAPDFEGGH